MYRFALSLVCLAVFGAAAAQQRISTPDNLVSSVLMDCYDMGCLKTKVLNYLDTILGIQEDSRNIKNIDAAIFKRMGRVIKTHEFRLRLPEVLFGGSEVVYNPRAGLDIATSETESRGSLKRKVLLPVLLLLKLKMKALMPIFLALIGIKALKALILSKLAITLVVGFLIYTLCKKGGMNMPMAMMPVEPPAYGPPATSSPSSYEPSWEPSNGGPYSRVWSGSDSGQSMAYSAYYPGSSASLASSSTTRP